MIGRREVATKQLEKVKLHNGRGGEFLNSNSPRKTTQYKTTTTATQDNNNTKTNTTQQYKTRPYKERKEKERQRQERQDNLKRLETKIKPQ